MLRHFCQDYEHIYQFGCNVYCYGLQWTFLFSLVNPLEVGAGVNLTLRGFCSDEMEDGTEKPPVDVLIRGLIFTAKIFAELVVHSLKVYAEFVIHSSGVYCWSYCQSSESMMEYDCSQLSSQK